jgi:uncharacterized protein YfeS
MDVSVYARTYNSYGGSTIFSPIGDLLYVRLGEYGEAINEIEMTMCLRNSRHNPLPTLESMFEQYHKYIKTLPKITFRRKRKLVEMQVLCRSLAAEDNKRSQVSVEKCNRAMIDVMTALPLLKIKLKGTDDFDLPRFLTDAQRVLQMPFRSEDEIRNLREQANGRREIERAKKDPWELLDIDWDEFHPKARQILDDPFFWDCVDDFAPHGNDTGADLLADYQKWVKRNPHASPMTFLDRLLARWGIEPIDWSLTDEAGVRQLHATKPIELSVCNEAIVALAFAALKVKGECPSDVAGLAIKAIDRDSHTFIREHLEESAKRLLREASAKMKAKLELF